MARAEAFPALSLTSSGLNKPPHSDEKIVSPYPVPSESRSPSPLPARNLGAESFTSEECAGSSTEEAQVRQSSTDTFTSSSSSNTEEAPALNLESLGAIAIDQPLPSFAFPSSNMPTNTTIDMGSEEDDDVPSPYQWGEHVEGPMPPGLEAFPPIRNVSVVDALDSPGPLQGSVVADEANSPTSLSQPANRWHTHDKPTFTVPDVTPKSQSVQLLPQTPTANKDILDRIDDDEYADEIPGEIIGLSPPTSGANSTPIGVRGALSRGGGAWARPPQASHPVVAKARARAAELGYDEYMYGHSPTTPPTRQDTKTGAALYASRSPRAEGPTASLIEEQIPNFAHATADQPFNAFACPATAHVDPLGPRPAPVHARPSDWILSPSSSAVSNTEGELTGTRRVIYMDSTGDDGKGESEDSAEDETVWCHWRPTDHALSSSPHAHADNGSAQSSTSGATKRARRRAREMDFRNSIGGGGWASSAASSSRWAPDPSAASFRAPTVPPFETDADGWTTITAPTSQVLGARAKTRGGKAIRETWEERSQRESVERQAKWDDQVALSKKAAARMQARLGVPGATTKVPQVVDEDDPYGGW